MKWRAPTCAALLMVALGGGSTAGAAGAASQSHDLVGKESVPGDSLYQLPVTLTSAEGTVFKLSDLRGEPLVITMFYTHCTSVCPLLTTQLQRLMNRLPPAARHQVRVLMVSFDSLRDTPEVLSLFRSNHHIHDASWLVARASSNDVRALAAALGISYRELEDHSFSHSAVISVTDRDGTVRGRTSRLSGNDEVFLHAVEAQITDGVHQR